MLFKKYWLTCSPLVKVFIILSILFILSGVMLSKYSQDDSEEKNGYCLSADIKEEEEQM